MKISKPVTIGIFSSLSIIFAVVENFIPMPIPAVRLGLSNIPIIVSLYVYGGNTTLWVLILKIFLVPIFSGNMIFRLSISFPASVTAFIGMYIVYKFLGKKTTPISASVVGAYLHMLTQLLVINSLYIKGIIYTNITSFLMVTSVITGVITGFITLKFMSNSFVSKTFSI